MGSLDGDRFKRSLRAHRVIPPPDANVSECGHRRCECDSRSPCPAAGRVRRSRGGVQPADRAGPSRQPRGKRRGNARSETAPARLAGSCWRAPRGCPRDKWQPSLATPRRRRPASPKGCSPLSHPSRGAARALWLPRGSSLERLAFGIAATRQLWFARAHSVAFVARERPSVETCNGQPLCLRAGAAAAPGNSKLGRTGKAPRWLGALPRRQHAVKDPGP